MLSCNLLARHALSVATLVVVLAGCATPASMPAGTGIDEVRHRWGAPTLEFALPDGGRRLLYATGPFGRNTYRLDFDAQGRLARAEDVLSEAHFNTEIRPGMTSEEVLRQIGPPSYTWGVRYHDQTVWSYRFVSPFCLVFHVGITPQRTVEDSSYGPDPVCERRHFLGL
jgi:hypothetical protein